MNPFMRAAIDEAALGAIEGGIPIGSVLVLDGAIIGRGHNQRVQRGSAILHGEMDAIENAGRRTPAQYQQMTIYTTLSPCHMCAGAILLYEIPRVVIAENRTFTGAEDLLRSKGIEIDLLDLQECVDLMTSFISAHPDIWNEDIGEHFVDPNHK